MKYSQLEAPLFTQWCSDDKSGDHQRPNQAHPIRFVDISNSNDLFIATSMFIIK